MGVRFSEGKMYDALSVFFLTRQNEKCSRGQDYAISFPVVKKKYAHDD